MNEILLRDDQNAVATLTLNTPQRHNALSKDLMTALQTELDEIKTDSSIRAVIIKSSGKVYSPGHDLKQMTEQRQSPDKGKAYYCELFQQSATLMMSIIKLPQPVIAQVHGIATAAGCQLVASCDMAIAADNTRFGVNGVNIGLFCSTPMVALTRNIPRKKAFEMLTMGDFISAQQAENLGLINHAVPEEELDSQTRATAERLASQLGAAVKIGKEAFYTQARMSVEEAYAYTAEVMADNMLLQNTENGIAAFLDKRKPEWDQ